MLLAGAAYISYTWQILQIVTTVLTFACALLWFVMPESPRWFLATGKHQEAIEILKRGAARNEVHVILDESSIKDQENKKENPGSFADLFRTRQEIFLGTGHLLNSPIKVQTFFSNKLLFKRFSKNTNNAFNETTFMRTY